METFYNEKTTHRYIYIFNNSFGGGYFSSGVQHFRISTQEILDFNAEDAGVSWADENR